MSITIGSSLLTFGDGTSQNWASAIKGSTYSTDLLSVAPYGFSITIPSGTCMITMNFANVSLTGTDDIAFIIISGGSANVGPYITNTISVNTTSGSSGSSSSTGSLGFISSGAGTTIFSGTMNFWLNCDDTGNAYSCIYSGVFKYGTASCQFVNGYLPSDGYSIDHLQFYPASSNTFDGGVVNFTEYTQKKG